MNNPTPLTPASPEAGTISARDAAVATERLNDATVDRRLGRIHLHHDDYPATITALAAVVGHRDDIAGYEPTETGVWVDWEQLAEAPLSTTETAAIQILHGAAILERTGPPPGHIARPVGHVITEVLRDQ